MAVPLSAMFLVLAWPHEFRQGRRTGRDAWPRTIPTRSRSFRQTHGSNSLDERLDRLQQAEAKRTAKRQPDANYQAGQLVLSQLVGCPLGGGIVGWLLDRWFGTKPWLMLVMLFLGFAVGVWNVIRISNKATSKARGEQE